MAEQNRQSELLDRTTGKKKRVRGENNTVEKSQSYWHLRSTSTYDSNQPSIMSHDSDSLAEKKK